jgi:hypothetical protein
MLMVGLIANLLIRPVDKKHFMTPTELAEEKRLAHDKAVAAEVGPGGSQAGVTPAFLVVLAWAAVGIPLAWGVYRTGLSVAKFFN